MKKPLVFLWVQVLALAAWAANSPVVPPKHLADAKALVSHLSLENTSYGHGPVQVEWEPVCISHTDCSGFVDALLMHSYGYSRENFKRWFGSSRPTAHRYHDAIAQGTGFVSVSHVRNIRPGDLLAVKYPAGKSNTGHVMLAAGLPRQIAAREPVVSGTEQWELEVIDSSKSGHGRTDTRHTRGKDGKDHEGLGMGILRLYANHDSTIAGFSWSTLRHSRFVGPSDEHLVIGRLVPGYKP